MEEVKEEKIKHYENKQVKIKLKNEDYFTGKVVEEKQNYIVLIDKFGDRILLNFDEISVLRVIDNVEKNYLKRGVF